jgi:hypothetical protein
MFYHEQSFIAKLKQSEIEANAKHAWTWSKFNNQDSSKQASCCESITIPPQACCAV